MKMPHEQQIKSVMQSMTKQEMLVEVSKLYHATTYYSQEDYFKNSSSLTEVHYEAYLNRMKANRERIALLNEAISRIEKVEQLAQKYPTLSKETLTATANFFRGLA